MQRNFVRGLFAGLVGLVVVGLLLSTAGSAGARGQDSSALPRLDGPAGVHALSAAAPLTTTFSYQGQLKQGGVPVTNPACQIAFRLYDALSAGNVIGSPLTSTVPINNGLFTVGLNFGDNVFDGTARWLDMQVNCGGSFVPLTPRELLTAVPYAFALPGLYTQLNPTSPSLIGGYSGNVITSWVRGGVIGGGGFSGYENRVQANYGAVGGGYGNTTSEVAATVAGGDSNTASGIAAAVGGGNNNTASNWSTTVGGGSGNTASGSYATVGGGSANAASNWEATVGGGFHNTASGSYATVSGGYSNTATYTATVGGGQSNTASGGWATVGGGDSNIAVNSFATIGGGFANTAIGSYDTIGGGFLNTASGSYATIGGGQSNNVSGSVATVSGGGGNTASSLSATVGGGDSNNASGTQATIGGGYSNSAGGIVATVPGGAYNTALGDVSFAAGYRAKANHNGAFVWGDSTPADIASTAPNQFLVRASGGARFYGGNNWNLSTTEGDWRVGSDTYRLKIGVAMDGGGAGDVIIRAQGGTSRILFWTPGGMYIFSNDAQTAGVQLAPGGGSWSALSDRSVKANFSTVDGRDVLARLATIPIQTWNYTTQDASVRHIGPMAQDFYAAFNVGEDDKHITTIDADGVALAAIQGLAHENQDLKAQNASLEARLTKLEQNAQPAAFNAFDLLSVLACGGVAFTWFQQRRAKRGEHEPRGPV